MTSQIDMNGPMDSLVTLVDSAFADHTGAVFAVATLLFVLLGARAVRHVLSAGVGWFCRESPIVAAVLTRGFLLATVFAAPFFFVAWSIALVGFATGQTPLSMQNITTIAFSTAIFAWAVWIPLAAAHQLNMVPTLR